MASKTSSKKVRTLALVSTITTLQILLADPCSAVRGLLTRQTVELSKTTVKPRLGQTSSGKVRNFSSKSRPFKIESTSTAPDIRLNLMKKVRVAPDTQNAPKVIVAGAGLSGLCTAFELQKKGFDVRVFEAEPSHIGGRARTLRFNNGLYAEAGAMRIPVSHKLVRQYAQDFGLQLRPFVQGNDLAFRHIRGQALKAGQKDEIKKLYQLTDEEAQGSVADVWDRTISKILGTLSENEKQDLFSPNPSSPKVQAFIRKTLYQALVDEGTSVEAMSMLGVNWGIETLYPLSLDEHLREEIDGIWTGDFHEIVGGTDRLATSFASQLRNPVQQGREVFKIERPSSSKVIVHHRGKSGDIAKEEGDWLVCTLPLGVLSRTELTPEFSPQKMDGIRKVYYDAASKVLAVTSNRFWELNDGIYGGGTMWDGVLGSTWYPSDNASAKDESVSNSPSTLLASYSWGELARDIDAIPPKNLHGFVVAELAKVHPVLKQHPEYVTKVLRWSWDNHPWSSGAYAFFRPGEHLDHHSALLEPEDRVILAGEHTSLNHSWMEGALESALRSVKHIVESN